MKKIFFIFFILSWSVLNAQVKLDSNAVPLVVRAKLHLAYPHAKKVTWISSNDTEDGYENGKPITKRLCFEVIFRDSDNAKMMCFDSTATWYRDNNDIMADHSPQNIPQKAIDKVNELIPGEKDIFNWQYALDADSAKYDAGIALKDSSSVEYECYFDSLWNYLGMEIDAYENKSQIQVPSINNYLNKHYRHSEFMVANIRKDKNGNVKSVLVMLGIKWTRYKKRILKFDGKGNLTEAPQKTIRRRMIIDF